MADATFVYSGRDFHAIEAQERTGLTLKPVCDRTVPLPKTSGGMTGGYAGGAVTQECKAKWRITELARANLREVVIMADADKSIDSSPGRGLLLCARASHRHHF